MPLPGSHLANATRVHDGTWTSSYGTRIRTSPSMFWHTSYGLCTTDGCTSIYGLSSDRSMVDLPMGMASGYGVINGTCPLAWAAIEPGHCRCRIRCWYLVQADIIPPKGIKMPQGPPEPPPDDDDPDKESSVHTSDIRSVLRQHIKKEGDGW